MNFLDTDLALLAVAAHCLRDGATVPPDVLVYKTALKIEPVLEALSKLAGKPASAV